MSRSKDAGVFLRHALACVRRIRDYTADGEAAFHGDTRTQDAVLRNLEVIGQCIKDEGISALAQSAPEIDWRTIAAFRNVLAHEYLGVDMNLVWRLVIDELPALEQSLQRLIEPAAQ